MFLDYSCFVVHYTKSALLLILCNLELTLNLINYAIKYNYANVCERFLLYFNKLHKSRLSLSAHLWIDLHSEQTLKVLGVILMGGKAVC